MSVVFRAIVYFLHRVILFFFFKKGLSCSKVYFFPFKLVQKGIRSIQPLLRQGEKGVTVCDLTLHLTSTDR